MTTHPITPVATTATRSVRTANATSTSPHPPHGIDEWWVLEDRWPASPREPTVSELVTTATAGDRAATESLAARVGALAPLLACHVGMRSALVRVPAAGDEPSEQVSLATALARGLVVAGAGWWAGGVVRSHPAGFRVTAPVTAGPVVLVANSTDDAATFSDLAGRLRTLGVRRVVAVVAARGRRSPRATAPYHCRAHDTPAAGAASGPAPRPITRRRAPTTSARA